jgi:hypothetical protein
MMMLQPDLTLAPRARVVVNSLYVSDDPGVLTDDLLLVELPNRTFIDVSWYPELDPDGAYSVAVFRDGNRLIERETKSAQDAVRLVEELATEFTRPIGSYSCSGGEVISWTPSVRPARSSGFVIFPRPAA